VTFSTERSGDPPLLLLDDILSELDAERREQVLGVAYGVEQVVITTPDADRPGPDELPDARRYRVEAGQVTPLRPGN
jgi:DNA replication and repair protein RecF